MSTKPKDAKFYTELVLTTILSLMAASMWIEFVKGFVQYNFQGQLWAMLGVALSVTLLAIFCLQYTFNDSKPDEK